MEQEQKVPELREGAKVAAKKDRSANSLRRVHASEEESGDDSAAHGNEEILEAKKAAEMLNLRVAQSGSGEAISMSTTLDALSRNSGHPHDRTSTDDSDDDDDDDDDNKEKKNIDEKKISEEKKNEKNGDAVPSISVSNHATPSVTSSSSANQVSASTSANRMDSGGRKKVRSSEHVNLSGGTGWRMESFHKGLVPLEALSKARLLMAFDAADRQPNSFVWYEPYFFKHQHVNFLGKDRDAGWMFLSLSTSKVACWDDEVTDPRVKLSKKLMYDSESDSYWSEYYGFRALVRWVGGDRQYVIGGNMVPMGTSRSARMLRAFQRIAPDFDAVRWVELPSKTTPGRLLALERAFLPNTLNAGLILCTSGRQISCEADLYADVETTPRFKRFCKMLGSRRHIENPYEVDGSKFLALVSESGTNNAALTINWHVNTQLSDSAARRRHISLASIVVLYIDTPGTVVAPFLCAAPEHCVFIVLSPEDDEGEFLRVEIIRRVGIVRYIPPLPDPPLMKLSEDFKHWIAAKVLMGSRIIGQLSGSLDDRAHRLEIIANSYPKVKEKVEKRMATSKFAPEESQLSKLLSEQNDDGLSSSNEHRSPASRLSSSSSSAAAASSSASAPGRQSSVNRAYINKLSEHATNPIEKSQCDAFLHELGQCDASDLVNNHTHSLLAVLCDVAKMAKFREFLLREYALENLVFFLSCEKFKRLGAAERSTAAQDIYALHIAQRSRLQVNLPHSIRDIIDEAAKKQFASTESTLYQFAQISIFRLLQSDSFRRFEKTL